MTMVASFAVHNQPILIGDLMLSKWFENPPGPTPFAMPTLRDANAVIPGEWGWRVVGLRQKIALLGEKIAVAWSGSQVAAAVACQAIQGELSHGAASVGHIESILRRLDLGKQPLLIAGLVLSTIAVGTHAAYRFAWDSSLGLIGPVAVTAATGEIYGGGSGKNDLVQVLQAVTQNLEPFGADAQAQGAVAAAIGATTILAGEQMRLNKGLDALYGGGFEIATVNGGKIAKMGDITHWFMDAVCLDDNRIRIDLKRAIAYEYRQDVLLVRTLDIGSQWLFDFRGEQIAFTYDAEILGDPAIYAVFPINRSPTEQEFRWLRETSPSLRFGSRFVALYVHLPQRQGTVKTLVFYSGGDKSSQLEMRLDGDGAEIRVGHELIGKIRSLLA